MLRQAFFQQAESCETLGSPFTAKLLRLVGENLTPNHPVGAFLHGWPFDTFRSGAEALRLAGALHSLVLLGKSPALALAYPPHSSDPEILWSAVDEAMRAHPSHLIDWMASPPQTNEIRRCAALIPAFHLVAEATGLPLLLSEIGASAGLNLNWDSFALEIDGRIWGPAKAEVRLTPDWQGKTPPWNIPQIAGREGCDIQPLDPCNAKDRLRMLSYIWPDQIERIENTKRALDLACLTGHTIRQEDALTFLSRRLVKTEGVTRVIYHTIMWQYLSPEDQSEGTKMIEAAGHLATDTAPLAWLRAESDGLKSAAVTLSLWPSGETRELGRMDFHGRWIRWNG